MCRPSKLSLIQADIVKRKIESIFPDTEVEIIPKPSLGDLNLNVPIYALGEKDVFTKDIDAWWLADTADIAVHSMKDTGADQYPANKFASAVVEREMPHDVVIFNTNIEQLISAGKTIRIGTASLRREELVPPFLKKALPQGATADIKILPIRGNVDTRLKKLRAGDYDAIVLAAAGLIRLLNNDTDGSVQNLLRGTKKMFLPLIDCTPAPAQGALLAVAYADNKKAATILEKINDIIIAEKVHEEQRIMQIYGGGCIQRFGVHAVAYRDGFFLVVAGADENGKNISATYFDTEKKLLNDFSENSKFLNSFSENKKNFFSATDFMKNFFIKKYFSEEILIEKKIYEKIYRKKNIFVAHHHAVGDNKNIIAALKNKIIWTAGTRTWFELAARGIWVEGCADGFGLDWLSPVFQKNIIGIIPEDLLVLTNDNVEDDPEARYEKATVYTLQPTNDAELVKNLQQADFIFWTSFLQFHFYGHYARENAQHGCPSGKTAEKLTALGLNPVIFPSIKVFLEWRGRRDEIGEMR